MNGLKDTSRRDFLKKTTYVVPVVLTLSATPALAGKGSYHKKKCNNGVGNGPDCLPPGIEKNGKHYLDNDDKWGKPGKPQNRGGFKKYK
ncbi:MAG: hypothetical protein IPM20_11870 [Gammaproteobacteria bacterium]|nr:hypothetical protein [Gammaproteobacteria bacterium]MCC6302994.1 hypothetical protein [Gammaproteobacteria bacterium]